MAERGAITQAASGGGMSMGVGRGSGRGGDDDHKRHADGMYARDAEICVYGYEFDGSGKGARATTRQVSTIERPPSDAVQVGGLTMFGATSEYGARHVLCDAQGDAWPLEYSVARLPSHVYLRATRFVRLEIFSERELADSVPPTHIVVERYSVHAPLERLEAVPDLFVNAGMHSGFDGTIPSALAPATTPTLFSVPSGALSSSSSSSPSSLPLSSIASCVSAGHNGAATMPTATTKTKRANGVAYLDADYFTLLDICARPETFLASSDGGAPGDDDDNDDGDNGQKEDAHRVYRVPGTFMTFSYRNSVDRRLRSKPEVARVIPNHWTSADFVRHMTRLRSTFAPLNAAKTSMRASEVPQQVARVSPRTALSLPASPLRLRPDAGADDKSAPHTKNGVGGSRGEYKSGRSSEADRRLRGDVSGDAEDDVDDMETVLLGTTGTSGTSGLSLTGLSGLLRSDATATAAATPSDAAHSDGSAENEGESKIGLDLVTPVPAVSSEHNKTAESRAFSLADRQRLAANRRSDTLGLSATAAAAAVRTLLTTTPRAITRTLAGRTAGATVAAATSPRRVLVLYAASEPSRTLPLLPCDTLHWGDASHAYELRYDAAVDVNIVLPTLDPPTFLIRGLSVQYHVRQLLVLLQRRHPLLLGRKRLRVSLPLPPGITPRAVAPLAQSSAEMSASTPSPHERAKTPGPPLPPASPPVFLGESRRATRPGALPVARGEGGASGEHINGAARNCRRDVPLLDVLKSTPIVLARNAGEPVGERSHGERNDEPTVLHLEMAVAMDRRTPRRSEYMDAKRTSSSSSSSSAVPLSSPAMPITTPAPESASVPAASASESTPVVERDPRYDVAPQLGPLGPLLRRASTTRFTGAGGDGGTEGRGGSGTDLNGGTGTDAGTGGGGDGRFAAKDITALERYVPNRNRESEDGARDGEGNGCLALHDITALERHVPDRNRESDRDGKDGPCNGRLALHDITALERHVPDRNRESDNDRRGDESNGRFALHDITALERHVPNRNRDEHDRHECGRRPLPPRPMFLPESAVRRCRTCPATKTQGCDYIRVLVFFNGNGRQIAMPCQPTVSQIINYATNTFQIDDVNHTFLLYTKSNASVPLSLNDRVTDLTRTDTDYAFVLRRSSHRGEACTWIAIALITIAITLLLIVLLAGLQEDPAFVNGRYNPWRSGRFLRTADGERTRGPVPDDGGFSFYRGEESQFSGWDW